VRNENRRSPEAKPNFCDNGNVQLNEKTKSQLSSRAFGGEREKKFVQQTLVLRREMAKKRIIYDEFIEKFLV